MIDDRKIWTNSNLWALAVGETVAWAGLYYIFPAALLRWDTTFEWGIEKLSVGFSIALICSALSGIFAGRLIDRGHSRKLMPISVLLGGILLCLVPHVTQIWHFYVGWGAIGITLSGCLYEPCFSFLTKNYQDKARKPIIMVTLIAGFASTLCYPCFSWLSESFGWHTAIYVFAISTCIICVPSFLYGTSLEHTTISPETTKQDPFRAVTSSVIINPVFWGIFLVFIALALNHGMIVSQIFPLLQSRELSNNYVVFFAACIGPMQVIGRLILFSAENLMGRNISALKICALCLVCLFVASSILYKGSTSVVIIAIFIILQGGPHGLISIVRPIMTAEFMGRLNFGLISSMIAFGAVWGSAIAPAISGSISERLGYDSMMVATATVALMGLGCLILILVLKNNSLRKSSI